MRKLKSTTTLIVAGALLLFSMLIWASAPDTSPNPYWGTQDPYQDQTLSINSQALGLGGPFDLQGSYSSEFGFVLNTKFAHLLTRANAIALEGDFGNSEYRFGATWGHAFSDYQRIKFTAERLAQDIQFDFASGNLIHWVAQNAFGSEYQLLLPHTWLHALDINGYYAKANSLRLGDRIFNSGTAINERRIAGAVSEGGAAGVEISPWQSGNLDLKVNYDDVNYHKQLEANEDDRGFGQTVQLTQLLNSRLKLSLLESTRVLYQEYQAGLFWLADSLPGTTVEFGLQGDHTGGGALSRPDNRFTMRARFRWDQPESSGHAKYTLQGIDTGGNLNAWTANPAVHMNEVMATTDQRVRVLNTDKEQNSARGPLSGALSNTRVVPIFPGEKLRISVQNELNQNAATFTPNSALPLGLHYNRQTNEISGTISKSVKKGSSYKIDFTALRMESLQKGGTTQTVTPLNKLPTSKTVQTADIEDSNNSYHLTLRVADSTLPYVIGTILDQTAIVGTPFNLPLTKDALFKDPTVPFDSGMTLTASGLPSGVTLQGTAGTSDSDKISGTATSAAVKPEAYKVSLYATNKNGTSNPPLYFNITVKFDPAKKPTLKTAFNSAYTEFVGHTKDISVKDHFTNPLGSQSPLTITVTGLGNSGLSYKSSSGNISGTPSLSAADHDYTVKIKACNGAGCLSPEPTFTIHIKIKDADKPHYDNKPIKGHPGDEEDLYTPTIDTSSSFSGTALVYSATGLPDGLTIGTKNGIISGTPKFGTAKTASYNVVVTVSNIYGHPVSAPTFTIEIKPAAPIYTGPPIPNQTDEEEEEIKAIETAPSFKGSLLEYSAEVNGAPLKEAIGLDIDTNTGRISGKLSKDTSLQSPYHVVVTAKNKTDKVSAPPFTFTIYPASPKYNGGTIEAYPATEGAKIDAISTKNVFTGNKLTYSATVNGEPLNTAIPGLTIKSSTGVITGTPKDKTGKEEPYLVTATATNRSGRASADPFKLYIHFDPADKPTLSTDFDPDYTRYVDYTEDISVKNHFTNPLGNRSSLTITVTGLGNSGLSYNSTTGNITKSPELDAAGHDYKVSIKACNGSGCLSPDPSFTIHVKINDNDKPHFDDKKIKAPDGEENREYGKFDISSHFTGKSLTFSATGLPDKLSIGSSDGVISGTPGPDSAKATSYSVVVSASNDYGPTASSPAFDLTIDPAAPTLSKLAILPITEIEQQAIQPIETKDLFKGSLLTYSATVNGESIDKAISGLEINSTTGEITGTPADQTSKNSPYSIVVTATNKTNHIDAPAFVLTIQPPAPSCQGSSLPRSIVGKSGYSQNLDSYCQNATSYTVEDLPSGLTYSNNVISGTPNQKTTASVRVTAKNDSAPNGVAHTFSLTISPATIVCPPNPYPTDTNFKLKDSAGREYIFHLITDPNNHSKGKVGVDWSWSRANITGQKLTCSYTSEYLDQSGYLDLEGNITYQHNDGTGNCTTSINGCRVDINNH